MLYSCFLDYILKPIKSYKTKLFGKHYYIVIKILTFSIIYEMEPQNTEAPVPTNNKKNLSQKIRVSIKIPKKSEYADFLIFENDDSNGHDLSKSDIIKSTNLLKFATHIKIDYTNQEDVILNKIVSEILATDIELIKPSDKFISNLPILLRCKNLYINDELDNELLAKIKSNQNKPNKSNNPKYTEHNTTLKQLKLNLESTYNTDSDNSIKSLQSAMTELSDKSEQTADSIQSLQSAISDKVVESVGEIKDEIVEVNDSINEIKDEIVDSINEIKDEIVESVEIVDVIVEVVEDIKEKTEEVIEKIKDSETVETANTDCCFPWFSSLFKSKSKSKSKSTA